VVAINMVSMWGETTAHAMHDTEKMIEFVRAKLATLPERGVEIPVKVLIGEKLANSAVSNMMAGPNGLVSFVFSQFQGRRGGERLRVLVGPHSE